MLVTLRIMPVNIEKLIDALCSPNPKKIIWLRNEKIPQAIIIIPQIAAVFMAFRIFLHLSEFIISQLIKFNYLIISLFNILLQCIALHSLEFLTIFLYIYCFKSLNIKILFQ